MGTIVRLCHFPCEMSRFLFSVIFHVLVTFPDWLVGSFPWMFAQALAHLAHSPLNATHLECLGEHPGREPGDVHSVVLWESLCPSLGLSFPRWNMQSFD